MEYSAGAIIFFHEKFLILKYKQGHWSFVKGRVEDDETLEKTFIRESTEETGLDEGHIRIIQGFRAKISYSYQLNGKIIRKTVVYFLAESNINSIILSSEHTDYQWLAYKDAYKQITYEADKKTLKKAYDFLNSSF